MRRVEQSFDDDVDAHNPAGWGADTNADAETKSLVKLVSLKKIVGELNWK